MMHFIVIGLMVLCSNVCLGSNSLKSKLIAEDWLSYSVEKSQDAVDSISLLYSKITAELPLSDNDSSFNEILNKSLSLGEGVLPPYWSQVKDLNRLNFNVNKSGEFLIDAWDYMHRQALYKNIMEKTSFSAICEPSIDHHRIDHENILWGLALQHGWQMSSGRLSSTESSADDTIIDKDAWWGDMNYYLSVIPYLGAVEAGISPAIAIIPFLNANFCTSYDSCPDIIDPWKDFFVNYIDLVSSQCLLDSRTPIADALDFNLTEAVETSLALLWKAHLNSIDTALPLFSVQLALLSAPEAEFGLAWANLVDLIAATDFPCTLLTTNILQNLLPPRVLLDSDQVPFIDDMTRLQNRAVLLIDLIYIADEDTRGGVTRAWDRLMCTESNRALGREMIMLGLYRLVVIVDDLELILNNRCN